MLNNPYCGYDFNEDFASVSTLIAFFLTLERSRVSETTVKMVTLNSGSSCLVANLSVSLFVKFDLCNARRHLFEQMSTSSQLVLRFC